MFFQSNLVAMEYYMAYGKILRIWEKQRSLSLLNTNREIFQTVKNDTLVLYHSLADNLR